jgi:Glycosyltransferase family 87
MRHLLPHMCAPPRCYIDSRFQSFLNRIASRWSICLLVFFLSVLVFAYRALGRAVAGFGDYAYFYLSSRAWLEGLSPYSLKNLLGVIPPDFPPALLPEIGIAYPPAIFPFFLPFAAVDWTASRIAFLAASTAAYFAACFVIIATVGTKWTPQKRIYFLSVALLMYPTSTGLALGQASIIAGSLLIIALCLCSVQHHPMIAGGLGAVSLAFKPQIGIIFYIYAVLRGRFAPLMTAIIVYLFMTVVGFVIPTVSLHDVNWVLDFPANYSLIPQYEYCCVNLRMITRAFTNHPTLFLLLEVTCLSILAALLLKAMFRHSSPPLLELSMLSILILLSSYHRPYEGIVLMLLLAWIFSNKQVTGLTLVVGALALPFFQPVPTLGVLSTYFANLPEAWPPELIFVWRFFVSAHAAWLLLALFLALYLVAINDEQSQLNWKPGVAW